MDWHEIEAIENNAQEYWRNQQEGKLKLAWSSAEDKFSVPNIALNLGRFALFRGEYFVASQYFSKSLKGFEQRLAAGDESSHFGLARVNIQMAMYWRYEGNSEYMLERVDAAEEHARCAYQQGLVGEARFQRGECHYMNGNYEEALVNFLNALSIFKHVSLENPLFIPDVARAAKRVADVSAIQCLHDNATKYAAEAEQAARVAVMSGGIPNADVYLSNTLVSYAEHLEAAGKFREAYEKLLEAKEVLPPEKRYQAEGQIARLKWLCFEPADISFDSANTSAPWRCVTLLAKAYMSIDEASALKTEKLLREAKMAANGEQHYLMQCRLLEGLISASHDEVLPNFDEVIDYYERAHEAPMAAQARYIAAWMYARSDSRKAQYHLRQCLEHVKSMDFVGHIARLFVMSRYAMSRMWVDISYQRTLQDIRDFRDNFILTDARSRVRAFGYTEFRIGNKIMAPNAHKKKIFVLYLLENGGSASVDDIGLAVWPEKSNPGKIISQTKYNLASSGFDIVEYDNYGYSLKDFPGYYDGKHFEREIQLAAEEKSLVRSLERYSIAASLWDDMALDLPENEWLYEMRQRYQRMHDAMIERALEMINQLGDPYKEQDFLRLTYGNR